MGTRESRPLVISFELTFSYVFSSLGWWNHDMSKTVDLWHQHRWNTRMVLADPEQAQVCWNDVGTACRKSASNPDGIEAWRVLGFWYWDECGILLAVTTLLIFQSWKSSRTHVHPFSLAAEQ